MNSDLVFRWYQYTGWNTEMILFRESYCALCARISVHRLKYRNDIIPRELLCPVCKDIDTQAKIQKCIIPRELLCTVCKDISTHGEIQKWYYSESYCALCARISVHRLRYRNDINPRVIVPRVQGYQYTGWDTEMILFRESYCAPCARISVHRLRYRNDIIPRELLCPVCKDISTQAEIQKWY